MMNGFPSCGAVGGKKEIMDAASTGLPMKQPYTFIGGTLAGNTLSMAACHYVVSSLLDYNLLEKAASTADDVTRKLNDLLIPVTPVSLPIILETFFVWK